MVAGSNTPPTGVPTASSHTPPGSGPPPRWSARSTAAPSAHNATAPSVPASGACSIDTVTVPVEAQVEPLACTV